MITVSEKALQHVIELMMESGITPDSHHLRVGVKGGGCSGLPCTISVQFVIRDGKLHCFDTMRSSDAWLGWPFDVFNFSMLAWMVLTLLRCRCNSDNHVSVGLELGSLHLTAGSQHLYIKNQDAVHEILADWTKSPSVPEYRLSTKTYIPLDTVLDNLSVKANALKCHHEIDPEKLFKPMFELAVAGQ